MQNKQQFRAYANATQTTARTRQVVMLYDAAIRNLQHTKLAIQQNRNDIRFLLVTRASEIMFGLQGCLDFESGGDVARVLYDFYSSIDARLLTIHRTNSAQMCDQLINEIKAMRDVWEEIDRTGGNAQPDAPAALPSNATGSGEGGVAISA